jgi:hypothetical protein
MNKLLRQTGLLVILMLALAIAFNGSVTQQVRAQDGGSIALGETKTGEITSQAQTITYQFTADAGQQVTIEAAGLTPGLAPTFTILNEAGALVVAVGNPGLQNTVSDTITFANAGVYGIQVSDSAGGQGQFLLSVLAGGGGATQETTNLPENQSFQQLLNPGDAVGYDFLANASRPLWLDISSNDTQRGPAVQLRNPDGELVALGTSGLTGFLMRVPPGTGGSYTVSVSLPDSAEGPVSFTIALYPPDGGEEEGDPTVDQGPAATEEPQGTPTDEDGFPILPETGPCVIATQGQIVNVREGPSTDYDQITTIGAYTIYSVLGENENGTWFQIDAQPEIGWVAERVLRVGGNCDDVPFASYPPLKKSSITGIVWHDLCAVPAVLPATPPEGCVFAGGGGLVANGVLDSGEPGIGGVVVTLGSGSCPSTGLASATTDSVGRYRFSELEDGTYCVTVNALSSTNSSILIPGEWTNPTSGSQTVTVGPLEEAFANFGWDYQFLPAP